MYAIHRRGAAQFCFRMTIAAALLGSLLVQVHSASAASYTFQPLGYLPGGSPNNGSFARGVSGDGSVVVGYSDSGSGTQAFLWTSNAGMQGLGDLPGGLFNSRSESVTADGTVTVGSATPSNHGNAFRWTGAGPMVQFDTTPSASPINAANGVSSDGTVIVGSRGTGLQQEAYRWTSGTGTVGLGDLPGGQNWSVGNDVSGDGTIVVGTSVVSGNFDDFNQVQQAFRWTSGTGMVPLDAESANAISSNGTFIVGHSYNNEAFRWTFDGGVVDLGDLPGGSDYSVANGVSDDGRFIVGTSSATGGNRAFLWTADTGMVNLRDYLIAHGATGLTNWQLRSADDISGDGTTFIGEGFNPNGKLEAWVATIPEPSTMALTATGMCALVGVALRRARRN